MFSTLDADFGMVPPHEIIPVRVVANPAGSITPDLQFVQVRQRKFLNLVDPRTTDMTQNDFGYGW
jgi:hypothetical protein